MNLATKFSEELIIIEQGTDDTFNKHFEEVSSLYGHPFCYGKSGDPTSLNPMFVPAFYKIINQIIFDSVSRNFYEYNEATGLWMAATSETMRRKISTLFIELGAKLGYPNLATKELKNSSLEGSIKNLAALAEGQFYDRPDGFVHCTNGMLEVATGKLHAFSPEFKSRNASPFAWDENATCPKFKEELLGKALEEADIEVIQLYTGMSLMGRNLSQKILLLTGTAGGGKSSLCKVIEGVIGRPNCTEARTKHLGDRFELARLVGKTLLTGKDVKGDFLMTDGAEVLKALSGGDLLDTEIKGSMERQQIEGEFCIIITCNSSLRVRLDGDTDAWRRRLILVNYERPKPERSIADFAGLLLNEEGSGILKWAVDGAKKLMDLKYHFPINSSQQARVDSLLFESDAVRTFVSARIERCDGVSLSTEEIVEDFFIFCDDKGWSALPIAQVERKLPDAMMEIHRASKSSSIEREGKGVRGFRGVRFVKKKL